MSVTITPILNHGDGRPLPHTRGPWKAEGPDWTGDYNIAPEGEISAVAAIVSNMRPMREVHSNAALVSAAPEMLAALISLLDTFERLMMSDVVERMRKIIAKAEGADFPFKPYEEED